jgi:hypothetical protein
MRAMAIPRLDPAGKGIHLLWTWPDVLPLSEGGYNIQRIGSREQRSPQRCESIDARIIQILRARSEYAAPLGPLRLRPGAKFVPITDPSFVTLSAAGTATSGAVSRATQVKQSIAAVLAASPVTAAATSATFDEFIQELNIPTDRVIVTAIAATAILVAMSAGKVVAVVPGSGSPLVMQAAATGIDELHIYTSAVQSFQICVLDPPDPKQDDTVWASAPYIVKGLTLPIHEADPTLATPAAEYAAATSRLIPGETLSAADFGRLVPSLRAATAAAAAGRSGERIVLVRSNTDDPYEEMAFEAQLSALTVHPKARRVLGFGYADRAGLTPGNAYFYRVTGRFRAEDLSDDIYDVHLAPSATSLPQFFTIRGMGVRFQTPVSVVLDPAPPASGTSGVSRRGIRIDTTGFDFSWLSPSFGVWSAIFDLPRAVTDIVLEVAPGHSFQFAGGDMWGLFGPPTGAVPPGPRAALHFAAPITQLRLSGKGTLYALRLPSGSTGLVDVHAYAFATFTAQPLPDPPTVLSVSNLQQPPAVITGPIDESTSVPPRPPLGFELTWLPATTGGVGVWPDDLDAGPPLDAIGYNIEHRPVTLPATFGPWDPVQGDDNFTVGSRDATQPTVRLEPGMDFGQVFPRIRPRDPGDGFTLHLSDVFGVKDPATGAVRPAEPPGSYHQYQIRAVDAVGRVSAGWTLSNEIRLEKHIPPPLPVDPQTGTTPSPSPIDAHNHFSHPPGPTARVIVKGAPGLTAADIALLGAHQNAILLQWGWRQQERDLDPYATEFRVYTQPPPDVVSGNITAVASVAPNWRLTLTVNRNLAADECAGQWIETGGYPFQILHNDAGTSVTITVAAAKANPSATPAAGPVVFGRPVRAEHRRPAAWAPRVAVYPITAAGAYQHVFYDLLTLTPAHPRDSIWVGVSSADSQSYIADELAAGPNAPRPGNESSIAPCAISARYQGQPVFNVPPPIGDVPELVTEEPTGLQILVPLDLVSLLGGALPAGSPIALERCPVEEVINRLRLNAGNITLTNPDGSQQVITFGNPGDQATVVAGLNSSDPQRLANRYVLYIVTHSTHPEAFFQRVSAQTDTVATINDRLPPKPARFLYRVRAADALGHVSDGGAILAIIVRVPSTAPAARPLRRSLHADNTGAHLTVAVSADPDTTRVLLFAVITPPGTAPSDQTGAELLRIPNRRDLYPLNGIRLRLADGSLLAPTTAKGLADMDVVVEGDGTRVVTLSAAGSPKAWAVLWCFALTRDGFASAVCGPLGIGVGA